MAAYHINAAELGDLGLISSPRIDMAWGYRGQERDWRTDAPARRDAKKIRDLLRQRYLMPQVLLPHAVAVVLGLALFAAARFDAPWLDTLDHEPQAG